MKRWFKIALKAVALLLVLFVVFLLFERWRGQISLARLKHNLTANGETLDVRKLIGTPVADEDNGAPEFLRLKDLIHPGKVVPNSYPPRMRLVAPGKAMVGWRENFWVEDKTTNSWDGVSLDLAANKQVLDQIRALLAKSAFDFKFDHSRGFDANMIDLASAKSMCQWFGAACQDALHKGENQAALDDLLATLAIPRIPENDHVVIGEMVRGAISSINFGTTWEALQTNVWTDEQLASLQKAWESNTFATNMILSLRVERADAITYFELFRKSNADTYKAMFPVWPVLEGEEDAEHHWWQGEFVRKQIYCRIWRFAWLDQDEKFYLEGLQQIIEDDRTGSDKLTRAPDRNWFGLAEAPRQNFYNGWRFGMSAQSVGTLSLAMSRSARTQTERSMATCAIALKRYQLRHGKPAVDLNALVPEFLSAVPPDFMDGNPVKYRLNPDGTELLYSVGDDGKDDGGDPSQNKPIGSYAWIWRGKDVVWPSPATREEIEVWRKETAKN